MSTLVNNLAPLAIVGDSIACGYGARFGWDEAVAREIGIDGGEVTNVSYPGARLSDLATERTIDRVVAARTVIVAAGLNDLAGVGSSALSSQRVFELTKSFAERLAAAGHRDRHVVVCTPNWCNTEAAARQFGITVNPSELAALRHLLLGWGSGLDGGGSARGNGSLLPDGWSDPSPAGDDGNCSSTVAVIDMWPALENQPELFPDGVHPNEHGHQIIAEWLPASLVLQWRSAD